MAKQELDEGLDLENAVPVKKSFTNKLAALFKFILSIILLPMLIGFTLSFSRQLIEQEEYILNSFVFGLVSYIVLHLFIYQPHSFYKFEQGAIDKIFGLFGPLKALIRYRLPLLSVIVYVTYFILKVFFEYGGILDTFVFLLSFTALMHLVLAAYNLKEESTGALKGDYFLSLSTVYLFVIILVAVFIKLMVDSFSILSFFREGFSFFIDTHTAAWKQLFVIK
jgi:hypothetical protein